MKRADGVGRRLGQGSCGFEAPVERSSSRLREGARRAMHVAGLGPLVGLGAAGAVLGCGGDVDVVDGATGYRTTNSAVGVVARQPGFVPLACDTDEYPSPLYLQDLRPSLPVDYLD